VWRRGRKTTPGFAASLAISYAVLSLALLARAAQALTIDPATKISIDAPGRSNLILVILVLFVGGAMNLAQLRLVMGRVLSRLTMQAHSDSLTGAANRRGLLQALTEAQRSAAGYALLMVDVDHFKAINDRFGHAEGDRVLKRVAQTLREGVRAGDVVARWGGEEFCLLLPGMGVADAQAWSERIALQIASSGEPRVTISVGVAHVQDGVEATDAVIQRADAALYLAKSAGRNRVIVAAAALAGT
jgi:diguanylate cyclase (GGDEF)-like protein